jgi:methyl-accepting chemotaxis protein
MKPFFRKKYFIDKQLQSKFILFIILLLLVYTLLFVVILFVPYMIPLSFDYPLQEQTDAARMLLSLHTSIWPALAIVIFSLSVLSIFISHKVAGPLYRLKRSLAEIAAGSIEMDMKFRKRDELHDLADSVNLVIHELRILVGALEHDHATVCSCIADIEQRIENHQFDAAGGRGLIEKLQALKVEIDQKLDKYSAND